MSQRQNPRSKTPARFRPPRKSLHPDPREARDGGGEGGHVPPSATKTLAAILACLLAGSVGLGMTSPLIALVMNAAGFTSAIGINTATMFRPRDRPFMRSRHLSCAVQLLGVLIACLATSAVTLLLIRVFEPAGWHPLRLVIGCGVRRALGRERVRHQSAGERAPAGTHDRCPDATLHAALGFAGGAYLVQEIQERTAGCRSRSPL
ncbi:MAG: hypothetical protein U1E87_04815 [Alphaproteobacteria bacterium]